MFAGREFLFQFFEFGFFGCEVFAQGLHFVLIVAHDFGLVHNLPVNHREVFELRLDVFFGVFEQVFRLGDLFFQCRAFLLHLFDAFAVLRVSAPRQAQQQQGDECSAGKV